MPITANDLKIYLSTGSATGSDGGATSTPANSLGGYRSSTEFDDPLTQVFDTVGAQEAEDGDVEYRCIFVRNEHATLTWEDVKVFIATETPSPTTSVGIALDLAAINAVADTIADESTAPAPALSFTRPLTPGAGLTIGNLAPNAYKAIWIRRTVGANTVSVVDSYRLEFVGETAP